MTDTAQNIMALQDAKPFTPPGNQQIADIMLNESLLRQAEIMAKAMASAKVTIPKHLQGNEGDCYAIVLQSLQWKMNPFAVAQKTHISQSGQLGYEAQLVNAVITTLAPITGRPDYRFIGDWDKILGKVAEREGKSGGKYYVATWNKADEEGLGVIVSCRMRGDEKPREVEIKLSQCYPRFSTQWATDPQQQICYVGIRKWARRHCPDVILGVYTPDELMEISDTPASPRDVTPSAHEKKAPPAYSSEAFERYFPKWSDAIRSGEKTADALIAFIETRGLLTEKQKKALRDCEKIDAETASEEDQSTEDWLNDYDKASSGEDQ